MNSLLFKYTIAFLFSIYAFYYHSYYLLIPLFLYLILFIRLNIKYVICLIIIVLFTYFYFFWQTTDIKITNLNYQVYKVNEKSYYIANSEAKVMLTTKIKLNINDEIKLRNTPERLYSYNNERLFNVETYMLSIGIKYQVKDDNLIIIKKSNDKQENNNKLNSYFNYLYLMNSDGINKDIKDSLIELSLIHLVIISGFHFNLLYKLIYKILFFINNTYIKEIITFIFLFAYLMILSFAIPCFRAFLSLLISKTKLNKYLNKCDQLALVAFIIFLFNPLVVLGTSFQLTFYISLIIILISEKIKQNKICLSFIIFLFLLPFITNMNYEISIFSFLYQIIYLPIMVFLYIIVFLGHFMDIFKIISINCIDLFETSILLLKTYNIKILTGYIPLYLSSIYILFLLYFLYNNKKRYLIIAIIFMAIIIYFPSPIGMISYIDVGQADCIIIKIPFSDSVMMIDVGQPMFSKNVENIIYPTLKANKVRKVDLLVITHDDIDHSGGLEDLKKKIKIDKVIRDKQYQINYKGLIFYDFLYKDKFKDKNDNSITLYTKINNLNYLFTGDISKKTEFEFKKYINKLPVDILKVAHHGSKTSSSQDFLSLTNPKVGIIMTKKNNNYHHPHPETIKRLEDNKIDIFKTSTNGSITIYYSFFLNYLKSYK